jgi:Bacterial conjugation TrbI-like protein
MNQNQIENQAFGTNLQVVNNQASNTSDFLPCVLQYAPSTSDFERSEEDDWLEYSQKTDSQNEETGSTLNPVNNSEEPEDPLTVRTNHSFVTSPYSKGALVIGMTSVVIGVLGVVLFLITGGMNLFAQRENPGEKTNELHEIQGLDPNKQKISELETDLAIGSQAEEIRQINQSNLKKPSLPLPPPTPPAPIPIASPPPPAPIGGDYHPSPPTPFVPSPVAVVKEKKNIDPMKEWLAMGNLGSYGYAPPPEISTMPTLVNNEVSETTWKVNGGVGASNSSDNSFNTNSNSQQIIVGTKATGVLETPVAWSGKILGAERKFLIKLQESLKGSDPSSTIPGGTLISASIEEASEQGILQMSATSIIVTDEQGTKEKPLPTGSVLILGKGGNLLKADAVRKDTIGNDIAAFLLSGIGGAASLLNRPQSQSITSNSGGFSSYTENNGNPDLLAGFASKGAEAMVERMNQRNQASLERKMSDEPVFVLKQGTKVQVFVNQTFSF